VTEVERIRGLVGRTERRLALLVAQDAATAVGAAALGLFAVVALGARFALWRGAASWVALGVGFAAVIGAFVWRMRVRHDERAAARIDAEYGLDDRVRSALAVLRDGELAGMAAGLVADAAESTRGVDPSRAVAYERPRRLGWLAAAIVATAVVVGLPDRWLVSAVPEDVNDLGDVRSAGKDLETRSLEVAREADPKTERLRQLAIEQADLGARLQRDELSPRDALARLSSLEERINRSASELGTGGHKALGATRRRMEKALDAASRSGKPGDKGDAAGDDGSGKKSSDSKGDGSKSERSLSEQAREAAAAAREGTLTSAEKAALQDAARQLGSELEGVEGAEALQAALDAIAEGDLSAEELDQLAEALEGAEASAAAQEAAAQLRAANRAAKQGIAGKGQVVEDGEPGPFAGRGSTNEREGRPYTPEDKGSTMKDNPDERPDTKGDYEAKYESERLDQQGYTSQARGKLQGSGRGTSLYVQTAPGKAAATVPYQEAYPRYLRSAERSIERSDVPPEMRGVVRDYFDSINPQ
jgi:hypothetical protein